MAMSNIESPVNQPSPSAVWLFLMSRNSETLRALLAPTPNYKGIPTLSVGNHEVPLPAYWQITELLEEGIQEEQIVRMIVKQGRGDNAQRSVEEIVNAISNNLHQIELTSALPTSAATTVHIKSKGSKRFSAILAKRPKRISAYHTSSSRLSAHDELADAESVSESKTETQEEQKLNQLETARALARRKELLKDTGNSVSRKITKEERRRTIAAIDHDINKSLHRYAEIETQMEYARRLTFVNKGPLH